MTIEERIQKLERENHRLKHILTGVAILGLSIVLISAKSPPSAVDTLIAKRVLIVDDNGRERISLFTDKDTADPVLYMYDTKNQARVTVSGRSSGPGMKLEQEGNYTYLGMLDRRPALALASPHGEQMFSAVLEERGPHVLIGAKGQPLIQIAAYEGVPTFGMSDANAVQRVLMTVLSHTGLIAVVGKNDQQGPNVTLTADDQFATVEATDRNGGFAQLGAAQEAEPSAGLTIYDKGGTARWSTRRGSGK